MIREFTIKSILLLIGLLLFTWSTHAQWLTGYSFKKEITILPNQIPNNATLTDFPMLIDITGSYLLTTGNGGDITNANGYDIAFTVDHTTALSIDIIYYEGTATGEYKAWVKVPSIQDGTVIYMYYGNASISSDPSTSATWGNNYEGVWQLDNDFNDASPNGRNGTNNGSVNAGGVIQDAQDFEYSDMTDHIDVGNFNVPGYALTISSWIYLELGAPGDGQILAKATGVQNPLHHYALSARNVGVNYKLRFRLITNGVLSVAQSGGNINSGGWYYASAVYDGSDMMLYINGIQSGSLAKTGPIIEDNTVATYIGNNPGPDISPFDGIIDQVSLSSAARSGDWILAECNNQGSPSTFYFVGAPITFNGRFILPVNSYLFTNNNNIVLYGYLVNNGTLTHNGGTIIFAGIDQAISGISTTEFNNITINNSSTTNIFTAGQSIKRILFCDGTLNAGGNLTLLSTPTQTALIDGTGTGSISGNVTMQRYLPSGFGYKYFSSPFQAATVSEFADDMDLSATFPTFYEYDESKTSSGWVIYTTGTNLLNPMQGYAVNFGDISAAKTVDVTGALNDGTMQVSLDNNNNTYTLGFNLVGNPYPSPIDWDAGSGWTKTNIDDALYFFKAGITNQYTGTYSTYINGVSSDGIADNIIPSMQGFFVHVTDGSYPVTGTLGFSNSIRTNDLSPVFIKSSMWNPPPLIRIAACFAGNEIMSDPAVVYFDEESTKLFDGNLDALKLMNTDTQVPNFYVFTPDSRQLSISAMPHPGDEVSRIPLGIKTEQDGWVNFRTGSKEQMPQDLYMYFVDAKAGVTWDLKSDSPYDTYLDAGEHNSQFYLIFSREEWKNPFEAGELFTVHRSGYQVWVVTNLQFGESGILRMINARGQVIWGKEVQGNEKVYINSPVSSGIYVISLFSDKQVFSKKVFLQ